MTSVRPGVHVDPAVKLENLKLKIVGYLVLDPS